MSETWDTAHGLMHIAQKHICKNLKLQTDCLTAMQLPGVQVHRFAGKQKMCHSHILLGYWGH